MRLRTVYPPLSDELIEALEGCNIRTDVDLLFSATPMQIYQRISPCSTTLAELVAEIKRITITASASVTHGSELLEYEQTRHECSPDYSSGLPELDRVVGGFGRHGIIEISGDRKSGKSLLALQVAVRHLSSCADHSALWIDTTGDFSIDRVMPIISSCVSLPGVNTAAARLQLALAFDLDTIYEALQTVHSVEQPEPIKLVIIDNVTPIFRPLLSAVSAQGHAMMTMFMHHLRSLAQTCSVTILIINGTSAVTPNNPSTALSNRARKPALGPSFTYMTDSTLWLSRSLLENGHSTDKIRPIHTAEILRSKWTPSNIRCRFTIQDGILHALGDTQRDEDDDNRMLVV